MISVFGLFGLRITPQFVGTPLSSRDASVFAFLVILTLTPRQPL
jgi:hypothetical protein